MSQATTNTALTKFWNMSAPLHPLLIEKSTPEAEKNIDELVRAGFSCKPQVIATRSEFLESISRFPFDVVLSDYRLPGWTGIEAFSAMRRAGRDVPFILVTETLGEEVAVECIKQGITDYVLKDNLARLPVVVARALEERALRDARQLMIQALRQSEGNSLFLFAKNPLPMWVFEMETLQFLQVNDAALRHYGFTRAEFLQMNTGALHPAEEIPQLLGAIRDTRMHERLSGEWRHRKKDGSVIDVEMFLHKMDYSGVIAGLVVALDITERKRAEEEKQKFFTLVEYSRDFIAVADLNDNVQYVNPAGRAMLGIPSEESIKGTHSIDYVVPADLPLVYNTILPALLTSGHWEGELLFRHLQTGRSLPMDFVGFQVKDQKTGEPRFVATVSRDVTERRALERQLQQAQKFEAFGQLAGGIAHDFNNVIGAILGWAEMGEDETAATNPVLKNYFKKIHIQCDRVTALVQQLLAFARRQILEPKNLSLNQTVRDVMSLLDKLIGKDVEIKTNLADDLLSVRADPTQIEQMLINLCLNSRDAMPKGGTLTIETHNANFSEEDARNTEGVQTGCFAALQVKDSGMGMDLVTRERIFEPFFTTKPMGKGTGLGLATVYGIVKQHNGFIQVESEPGKGSTFRIFLPMNGVPTQTEFRPFVLDDLPVRGGNETILLADDHDGICEMAYSVLLAKGYNVLLAHDGEEAIEIFTMNQKKISLVLLDVIMPRRSGPEVFAAIKELNPRILVVFATGYSNETAVLADLVEHGVAILRKPYTPSALCRRVREVLDAVPSVLPNGEFRVS
ncbi:MAG TPA: response regulator [Candidatus Saccharimonadales bacterium]|jgi:two-component system cell cycle sensor histidine kinase/response regulator CckA|nr:response regulator [Candidatus Saccharimonadales bacterium]